MLSTIRIELHEIKSKWLEDQEKRDKILKDTISQYEIKIQDMARDADELHTMFVKELEVKEALISKTDKAREDLMKKIRMLTLKLKTPRHHLEFLKERGKLDEFIEAKDLG